MHPSAILTCPHLPKVSTTLPSNHARPHRASCGSAYYLACLELAQSMLGQQLPAQAILQLDKAMMAQLNPDTPVIIKHPIPYHAMQWILQNHSQFNGFIGNPVRHFQHLASRMNWKQPQPELRIARAWVCFHLAEKTLNPKNFPRDQRQIDHEQLHIPTRQETLSTLAKLSPHSAELEIANDLLTV